MGLQRQVLGDLLGPVLQGRVRQGQVDPEGLGQAEGGHQRQARARLGRGQVVLDTCVPRSHREGTEAGRASRLCLGMAQFIPLKRNAIDTAATSLCNSGANTSTVASAARIISAPWSRARKGPLAEDLEARFMAIQERSTALALLLRKSCGVSEGHSSLFLGAAVSAEKGILGVMSPATHVAAIAQQEI